MKKEIFAGGAGFTAFSSVPLVADDVNAYEIVYTAPEDLSGTTFEITALRADGEKIVDSGEVSGSTARYLMKNSMHAVVGDLRVRLSVLDASGACLTTKELVFEVIEGNGDGDVTADTNYPILTELIVDMRKAISDSEAVLNDLHGEISDLHAYADGKADAALASAKGYADTKDGESLATAKTYADTKDAENLSAAKTYADGKDAETLESAKSYVDARSKSLEERSKRYTDIRIGGVGSKEVEQAVSDNYVETITVQEDTPLVSFTVTDKSAPHSLTTAVYTITFSDNSTESEHFALNVTDYTVEIESPKKAVSVSIENIDSSVVITKYVYSVPLTAKEYTDTKAAAAEENAKTYSNQTFAGALKGEKLGGIVRLDDVSALDRRLDTVVSSKNIIPFPYADGMSKTVNGVTFTVSDDGSITVNGTATSDVVITIANNLYLEKGSYMLSGMPQIELSGKNNGGVLFLFEKSNEKFHLDYSAGAIVNIEQSGYVVANIKIYAGASVENVVVKPMLECGTSSTAYTKHVSDLSGVSLKKFGKNLIPYPYAETTKTVKGLNFTDNGDGSVTVNGTATADATFYLKRTSDEALPRGTYFLSGCPRGGAVGTYNIQPRIDGVFNYDKYDVGSGSLIKAKNAIDALVISVKSGTVCNNLVFRPQLELGGVKTAFESPGAPTTYTVGADGAVQNLSAYEDVTTLATDNEGTVLKTKYSRDLGAAFTEIQNAIIALGGSF